MVLESIFPTKELLKSNVLLFVYTAFISVISITVAYVFYKSSASILTIAFITIAFIYFLNSIYFHKEKEVLSKERSFFGRYMFIIEVYIKIFVVIAIIFTVLYVFLPTNYRTVVFKEQTKTLTSVGNLRSSINIAGNFFINSPFNLFLYIFLNNLGVLLAILLFSFIYGVGAIFINIYQASVFGTFVGVKILSFLSTAEQSMSGQALAFLQGSISGLGLLPHGTFELLAYFLACIVGGIVSAILHGHYIDVRKNLKRIILDMSIILGVAVVFLLIGAIIEANIVLG